MASGREFGNRRLQPGGGGVVHTGDEHDCSRRCRRVQPIFEMGRTKPAAVEILPLRHHRQPTLSRLVDAVIRHDRQLDASVADVGQQHGVAQKDRGC